MWILFSDDGFTLDPTPLSNAQLVSAIGGTTVGTVDLTQSVVWDSGSESVSLPHGTFSGGSFSDTLTVSLPNLTNPFMIMEEVMIVHSGAGATSFDAESSVVPVPGAVLLGILGLSAAGIKLRKFA